MQTVYMAQLLKENEILAFSTAFLNVKVQTAEKALLWKTSSIEQNLIIFFTNDHCPLKIYFSCKVAHKDNKN